MSRLIAALTFLAVASIAAAQSPPKKDLRIQVLGCAHDRGQVVANLFREGDDVLKIKKAYRRVQAKIVGGKATVVFKDLAYGKYAVSAFHDEDGDAELEHKFGFPAEPLGFSNNFVMSLSAGLPTFDKLEFQFGANTGVTSITLK